MYCELERPETKWKSDRDVVVAVESHYSDFGWTDVPPEYQDRDLLLTAIQHKCVTWSNLDSKWKTDGDLMLAYIEANLYLNINQN